MADSYALKILIKSTSDDAELKEAIRHLESLRTKANKASDGMDNMNKSSGKLGNGMKAMAAKVGAAIVAFGLIAKAVQTAIGLIKKSIEIAKEQENAEARLVDAMKKRGIATDEAKKDLIAHAMLIEKMTKFRFQEAVSVEASLIRYGMYGEQLKKATTLVFDFASAGYEQEGVVKALGKAFQGKADTLKTEYLPTLKTAKDGSIDFNDVLKEGADFIGGTAAAAVQTYQGRV